MAISKIVLWLSTTFGFVQPAVFNSMRFDRWIHGGFGESLNAFCSCILPLVLHFPMKCVSSQISWHKLPYSLIRSLAIYLAHSVRLALSFRLLNRLANRKKYLLQRAAFNFTHFLFHYFAWLWFEETKPITTTTNARTTKRISKKEEEKEGKNDCKMSRFGFIARPFHIHGSLIVQSQTKTLLCFS